MKKIVIAKYGETYLRGGNKRIYEKMLVSRISENLRKSGEKAKVYLEQGRILIEDEEDIDFEAVFPCVRDVLGLTAICECVRTEDKSIEYLSELCDEQLKNELGKRFLTRTENKLSFKVKTKRVDKGYPMTSNEISAEIGGILLERNEGLRVEMVSPDIMINVEVRGSKAYVYTDTRKGLGGLPAGSSGNAALLLSGGIDSPVAGFLAAKRGCAITAVYFHSPPYVSERARYKVEDLAKELARFTGKLNLYIVPFTDIQLYLKEAVPPERLTLLMKRQMMKLARIIAEEEKCSCLVTGDSVGQVASQTLKSLQSIDSAAGMTVLRPLCGMDKQEIIDIAKRIGTYEISVQPYDDCCTLFVAAHPETKPKASVIEGIERRLNLGGLIEEAFSKAQRQTIEA